MNFGIAIKLVLLLAQGFVAIHTHFYVSATSPYTVKKIF